MRTHLGQVRVCPRAGGSPNVDSARGAAAPFSRRDNNQSPDSQNAQRLEAKRQGAARRGRLSVIASDRLRHLLIQIIVSEDVFVIIVVVVIGGIEQI